MMLDVKNAVQRNEIVQNISAIKIAVSMLIMFVQCPAIILYHVVNINVINPVIKDDVYHVIEALSKSSSASVVQM